MHNQALKLYLSSQQRIFDASSFLDAQLERIYASPALLRDMDALLSSSSEADYLKARQENSKKTKEQIRSMPEDIRAYVYRHVAGLLRVDLHGEKNVNSLSYTNQNTYYQYRSKEEAGELLADDIQKGVTLRRTLRDPANFYREREEQEIAFTFDSRLLFLASEFVEFRLAAVVDENGNTLLLQGTEEDWAALPVPLSGEEKEWHSWESPLNRLSTYAIDSEQNGYRLIVCVDDRVMWQENPELLILMLSLSFGAGAVLLLLYGFNLRYDAQFLTHILQTVQSVRDGIFRDEKKPVRYRKNEYGLLAKEIDEMSERLNHHILTSYELRIKQQKTEMKALQNQINPHFLYNTLEAIRSMALLHQDVRTSDAIANLGALYRDIVTEQNTITIGDELTLLQKYLKIMELKYPDRFFYQFEIPEELLLLPTVKFWMQPLAENFFKHGFDRESGYNLLIVSGSIQEEGYQLQFFDNGKALSSEQLAVLNQRMASGSVETEGTSIGMDNVSIRLRYFYGQGFQMRIENNEENGVRIVLDIPKQER